MKWIKCLVFFLLVVGVGAQSDSPRLLIVDGDLNFVVLYSKADKACYLVVGPGHGFYEIERIDRDADSKSFVIRVKNKIGLDVDIDGDGIVDDFESIKSANINLGDIGYVERRYFEIDQSIK